MKKNQYLFNLHSNFKILFFLLFGVTLFSQNKISGTIIDESTEKPIKGVEIYINNQAKPKLISKDGRFLIQSDIPITTVTFSKKRYSAEVINFSDNQFENLVIKMDGERMTNIKEVILAGRVKKKYKNKKENPAYAIMLEVWKRKKTNGLANYNDYQFKEYEKIEIGLNNIDSTFKNKKIFNKLEFIFDYADSANFDKKLSLPIFFNETISKTYGKNVPDKKENKIIVANKFSGFNNNERMAATAKYQFKEVNLYDNTLNFYNIGFPSPVATDGFANYEYELSDSLLVNGTDCYMIKYFPKRKETLAFQGNLFISRDTYNIVKGTLKSPNKINVNFVNSIYMEVEYDSPNDTIFLPKRTYTELEMSIFDKKKDSKSLLFKRTDLFSDYQFNQNFSEDLLRDQRQSLSDSDLEKPDEYWDKNRVEPLQESEKNIYSMVSELQKVPKFVRIVKLIEVIQSGYINAWNAIDFGNIYSIYGYNEVEGDRLKFGARTYFSANDMWRVAGYAAYGLKDKKMKYGAEGKYMFNRENRATVGLGSKYDVVQLGARLINDEGILSPSYGSSGILTSGTNASLSFVKQNSVFFSIEPIRNFQVRLDASLQNIKSANPERFNIDFYKNNVLKSDLDDFHTTFSLLVQPGAKFSQYGVDRFSYRTLSPTFILKFTHGFENVLNGDFDYNKLQFLYAQKILLGNLGKTNVNFEAGKNFNVVPLALQNVIPGNQSYFLSYNTFSLLKYYEFVADTYSTLNVEHHFQGKILAFIPLIKKLKFRELVFIRGAYGTLSDASKNVNFTNKLYSAPDQQIYYEYGFGFENIGLGNLKIMRVDFNWRGNYLNRPEVNKFAVKFGVQVTF